MSSSCRPHALMLPFPETGHINPLMQLAKLLCSCHGFLITFVLTRPNTLSRISKPNLGPNSPSDLLHPDLRLVSLPERRLPEDDDKLCNSLPTMSMPLFHNIAPLLEDLIRKIDSDGPHCITCIIASDVKAIETLKVAQKLGIPRIPFWPPNASVHSLLCHAMHASSIGKFPAKGVPEPNQMVSFPGLPLIEGAKLPWIVGRSKEEAEFMFSLILQNGKVLPHSEWILCNSVEELEPTVQDFLPSGYPKVCPIGPILPQDLLEKSGSQQEHIPWSLFIEQDKCLEWLDAQERHSVLYVSMGSIAILKKEQLLELAEGLEASGVPILWVLRADIELGPDCMPEGYKERNSDRIRIVEWCPQLRVLSHIAVGGFLTHCGWNSTLEAMSMGVPLLAWPQMAEQFVNAELIVHAWGVGMVLGQGFVSRGIVESKVKMMMVVDTEKSELRARASVIRQVILQAGKGGGSSHTNLLRFVHWVNEKSKAIHIARTP